MYAIRNTWPWLIADLSFRCGDRTVEVDTLPAAPSLCVGDAWCKVIGQSPIGNFSVILPSAFLQLLFEGIDDNILLEKIDSSTAAVILEHGLTPGITMLESKLGTDLTFLDVMAFDGPVDRNALGIEFRISKQLFEGSLNVDSKLAEALEVIVQENSCSKEKNVDSELMVHLGPVVLASRNAYLAAPGSTIDCGVMPTEIINGVLMRSDNRYWPIHIEDDAVEIAGELTPPVDFSGTSHEQVFVTFALGRVELNAIQRKQLEPGQRLEIERYPDNGALVHYQTIPYAEGTIVLLGDNLAVNLCSIGVQARNDLPLHPANQS